MTAPLDAAALERIEALWDGSRRSYVGAHELEVWIDDKLGELIALARLGLAVDDFKRGWLAKLESEGRSERGKVDAAEILVLASQCFGILRDNERSSGDEPGSVVTDTDGDTSGGRDGTNTSTL